MKILYYDCFAGISGDMNLGALIDLGVDAHHLKEELSKLNIEGFKLEVRKILKKGIESTKADVVIQEKKPDKHRHLKDIREIIENSELNTEIKKNSLKIFELIARAEAKIHGKSIEEIHFHEVGAIDSIVDIVGAAICFDYLKPDKIMSSPVELGGGFVECAHGTFPVPAPATTEILREIPVKLGKVNVETTTPTGAAILAAMADEFSDDQHFNITKTGYGAGSRELNIPNVLRVYLAEKEIKDETEHGDIIMECNIDDMNPENYEHIIDMLFEHEADDVFLTPIIMKKNRPAIKLSVLCKQKQFSILEETILKETTTFGLRYYKVGKTGMDRTFKTVMFENIPVRIKLGYYKNELLKYKPEYQDCRLIAKKLNLPLLEVYKLVEQKMNAS